METARRPMTARTDIANVIYNRQLALEEKTYDKFTCEHVKT